MVRLIYFYTNIFSVESWDGYWGSKAQALLVYEMQFSYRYNFCYTPPDRLLSMPYNLFICVLITTLFLTTQSVLDKYYFTKWLISLVLFLLLPFSFFCSAFDPTTKGMKAICNMQCLKEMFSTVKKWKLKANAIFKYENRYNLMIVTTLCFNLKWD